MNLLYYYGKYVCVVSVNGNIFCGRVNDYFEEEDNLEKSLMNLSRNTNELQKKPRKTVLGKWGLILTENYLPNFINKPLKKSIYLSQR